MKSLRMVLAMFAVVAVVVACSAMQGKELTGIWQKEDGSGTIEFTKDGKLNVSGAPATISAPCKVDKDTLQVDLGILGTGKLKYALAKDSLTITDAQGKSVKFVKPKPAQPQEAPKAQPEPAKAPAAVPPKGK